MAPAGANRFEIHSFFCAWFSRFYRRYLQNTTNNVTGAQEDHDRSRYAAYSVIMYYGSVRRNSIALGASRKEASPVSIFGENCRCHYLIWWVNGNGYDYGWGYGCGLGKGKS